MGHFFILHYLIEFTVQFPSFFLYLCLKKGILISLWLKFWGKRQTKPHHLFLGKYKYIIWLRSLDHLEFFCFLWRWEKIIFSNLKISTNQVLKCQILHCIAIFPPRRGNMFSLHFLLNVKQGIISNWTNFTFLKAAFNRTSQCFRWDFCAIYHLSEPKSWVQAPQCFLGFFQIHTG